MNDADHFRGRTIPDPGFAGDEGDVDPALATALAAYHAGAGSEKDVVAALTSARVFVPVVAVLGEEADVAPAALRREKSADMALPTLVRADGRRALPAFTSLSALAAWRANARPVPVEARRAALAAVDERCDVMVIDVAGASPYVVTRPQLWALAEGRNWTPAHSDPDVRAAVVNAVSSEADVTGMDVTAGGHGQPEVLVVLQLRSSAAGPAATGAAAASHGETPRRVAERLAADPVIRARTSGGVGIAVLPPATEPS